MLIQTLPHGKSKLSVYKLVFRIRFKKLGVLIKLSLILVRRGTWLFGNFIVPPEIITMLGAKLNLVCSMISTVSAFNKSALGLSRSLDFQSFGPSVFFFARLGFWFSLFQSHLVTIVRYFNSKNIPQTYLFAIF